MAFGNIEFMIAFNETDHAAHLFPAAPVQEAAVNRIFVCVKSDPEFKNIAEKHDAEAGIRNLLEQPEKGFRGGGIVDNVRIRDKNDFSVFLHIRNIIHCGGFATGIIEKPLSFP